MRNLIILTSLLFLFSCKTTYDKQKNTPIIEENNLLKHLSTQTLDGDKNLKSEVGYVVVITPTLTNKKVFDLGLHLAGFYTYLESEANGGVETIFIAVDSTKYYTAFINEIKNNNPLFYEEMTFVSDIDSNLIHKLASEELHLDHAGFAIAYDANGNFLYELDEYRSQGEKLQRLHQTYYPRAIAKHPKPAYEIVKGKKLPTELLKYVEPYIGQQNVMITFYPSPLSHACSIQMDDFTQFSEKMNLKMFAVSIGNQSQINSWSQNQYVGLEMLADSTGIISTDFNSILRESDGIVYSDRTVFIIDKKGIVQYVNKDYDVTADLTNLENAILSLDK